MHTSLVFPYNNKKRKRIRPMASYRSNMNSNCYCQNGTYRQRSMQRTERQTSRNITVSSIPEQNRGSECHECECSCKRTDPLQDLPIAMAYVPWQQWRNLHDLCYGFQCGTIFQELEKPFCGKGGCCQ